MERVADRTARRRGIGAERARRLAFAVVALLEGGFLLSRAARTPDAVLAAGEAAVVAVRAGLVDG